MLKELQQEFYHIFDISGTALQAESDLTASDIADIAEADYGNALQLSAMLYSEKQCRRFLKHTAEYASAESAEPVYFSMLPFDGPYHRHCAYELTYAASGRLTYVMSGMEVNLEAGEALLMDLNCVHFDRNRAEDASVLYLHISPEAFRRFSRETGAGTCCRELLASEKDNIQRYIHYRANAPESIQSTERLFSDIIGEINRNDYGSREIFAILSCRLLLHLERDYSAELHQLSDSVKKDLFLTEMDRYVQKNLSSVTAGDLVSRFHYNKDYFCRRIKQKYGFTLTEYIQRKRVERAQQLLIQTELPVLEVIALSGYKNARYFYDIFKSATGMTPADYRKMAAEKDQKI